MAYRLKEGDCRMTNEPVSPGCPTTNGGGTYGTETPEQREARMEWWREARFGMFIHWGLYAVPAGIHKGQTQKGNLGEWIMNGLQIPVGEYEELAAEFNPVKFDADKWVTMAKQAGMKYIVITTKHHDGFAMYHSKVSRWNIVDATPFDRDPIAELARACSENGIRLGLYYSQAQDWYHPGGISQDRRWDARQDGDWDDYVRDIAAPQVREILTNYGPIAELWWDSAKFAQTERGVDMLAEATGLQPDLVVNGRLGMGRKGDFSSPEQWIPASGQEGAWEACMTMNKTWGYRSDDPDWKPAEDLLRKLVDIAAKGGNFLLNIGPQADGAFSQESVERLRFIGDWMAINGESIYATNSGPFPRLPWGCCTAKRRDDGATLYLHVFDWPADGVLPVPGLKNRVASARLLATGEAITTESQSDDVLVRLPSKPPDATVSVIALEIEGALDVDPRWPTHGDDGAIVLATDWVAINNRAQKFPQARIVGKGDAARIENWIDGKVGLEWPFAVDASGSFDATIAVADDDGGANETELHIDGTPALTATLPTGEGTGGKRSVPLGRIEIGEAGFHTVELRPADIDAWTGASVYSLRLAPVG
jgi:alpha-L-fucosidase